MKSGFFSFSMRLFLAILEGEAYGLMKDKMKVLVYPSALCWLNLMLPKVIKQNGAHELILTMYVVVNAIII